MTEHITVNEQSSIRISGEKTMYFDPLHISGAPHDADIVFITHEHFDHFSPDDIARVSGGSTVYAAPKSMADKLRKAGIPAHRTVLLEPGDKTEIEGIPTEAVPAYNLIKPFHPKRSGWLGYVVTVQGSRIYVCGDTDDTPEARSVRCDIMCVPIGGTYTVNAKKAAEFVKAVSPKAAIPIHYGTIVGSPTDADDLERYLAGQIKIVRKLFV